MANENTTAWLVRAGQRGKYARDFVTVGAVSIDGVVAGVGDLSTQGDDEVFMALQAADRRKPADDLRDLRMFSSRMAVGDMVVTSDIAGGDLVFGDIEGDYEYSVVPILGDHHHSRAVRWFGRLTIDHVEPFLAKAVDYRQGDVRRLPEQLHWLRIAGEVREGLGRPADDFPHRSVSAPKARSSTPRKRAPAKPPVVLVPDRLCPSCGLLRSPSMFVDGSDYCRDCD